MFRRYICKNVTESLSHWVKKWLLERLLPLKMIRIENLWLGNIDLFLFSSKRFEFCQKLIWNVISEQHQQKMRKGLVKLGLLALEAFGAMCCWPLPYRPGKSWKSSSSRKFRALQYSKESVIRNNGWKEIYVLHVGVAWWNPQILMAYSQSIALHPQFSFLDASFFILLPQISMI